jgi:hypothetical protein
MVMFWLVAPWPRELGLADVTVGTSTVTALDFGLSAPFQTPTTGMTEYFQVPLGTLSSVQLRPVMVPLQLAPTVCATPPLS